MIEEKIKEIAEKFGLHSGYDVIPDYHQDNLEAALKELAEYQQSITIQSCVEELLKQLTTAVYSNGYPFEGVAKATILSLPALLKLDGFKEPSLLKAAPAMLETLKFLDNKGGLGLDVHERIRETIKKAS